MKKSLAEPLVSVVIPLYNAEEWIEETVRSIQNQAVEPGVLDLILVDNGSTDGGVETARRTLRESALHYQIVTASENRGPSFARNAGWRRSGAPWIQFLDSDDLLLPEKVAFQLRAAVSAGPDVAAVYSEWQSYGCDGGDWMPKLPLRAPRMARTTRFRICSKMRISSTPAVSCFGDPGSKRKWLASTSAGYWLIEDVDLNLRLCMAGGRFAAAPASRALFYYRSRGSSLSRRSQLEFLAGCVRNLRLAEDYWLGNGLLTAQRTDFLLESYESLLHRLAPLDKRAFEELLGHVRTLSPGWLPRRRGMRLLSRSVGYHGAERLSIRYRELKAFWRRAEFKRARVRLIRLYVRDSRNSSF